MLQEKKEDKEGLQEVVELSTVTKIDVTQSRLEGPLKSMFPPNELDRCKRLAISLEYEVIPLRKYEEIISNLKRVWA